MPSSSSETARRMQSTRRSYMCPDQTIPTEQETPVLESSEAFLERAMGLLDEHIATMERSLEQVVGKNFAPGSTEGAGRPT